MKVLAMLPRVPYPLEKGDKLRAYYLLKALSKNNEIHLFCLTDQTISEETWAHLQSWCETVQIHRQSKLNIGWNLCKGVLQGDPLQVGYYYDHMAWRTLNSLGRFIKPDHAFFQLMRTARYHSALPDTPKTLDYMDAFAQGMKRRVERTSIPMKWVWQYEHKRLAAFEHKVFPWFDHHTIISAQDRSFINHPKKDHIDIITNGIDLERFSGKSNEKEYDLIFTGNMAYPPNVLASQYIVREIMPLLIGDFPKLKIALVGVDPVLAVKALASDRVTVTGWVDDIADYYARSRILLAPMQIGAGLQNKILEALALKLPCVVSPIAAQALDPLTKDFIQICQTPSEYASKLKELLSSEPKREQLGEASYQFIKENHDWEKIGKKLEQVMLG